MATATARAERRLAAILAADVLGYSRLIEQDETATLAALRALRQEVIDPLLAETPSGAALRAYSPSPYLASSLARSSVPAQIFANSSNQVL